MIENEPLISEFKSKSGLKRLSGAFYHSLEGFKAAWTGEHAFRQEVMVIIPAAVGAFLLPVAALEKLALISVLLLVLIVELLNSAVEAAIDRISMERHLLSKKAKDYGSAAVFLAIVLAAATWGAILLPLFFR